jgi:hypothetical protein
VINEILEKFSSIGRGINNTISISNTIKIIARRKNRRENGIRALWLGSNPHSNGDAFSRSDVDRVANLQAKIKIITGIIIAIEDDVRSIIIYYIYIYIYINIII